jgi:hypothetical protein
MCRSSYISLLLLCFLGEQVIARHIGVKHPVTLCSFNHICKKGECGLKKNHNGADVYYDLSLLTLNVSKPETHDYTLVADPWKYYVNVCADTKTQCGAGKDVGDAIRANLNVITECQVLGDSIKEWNLLNPNDATAGVSVLFIGGDSGGGCTSNRTVEMAFRCEPTIDGQIVSVEELTPDCDFVINFDSKYGCPAIAYYDNPNPKDEGISGGSIFLIIFFVGGFVYVVGGIAYNMKAKDKHGMEAFPNHTFWFVQLPGYVRDGIKYTKDTLFGACRKDSKEEYEEVTPAGGAAAAVNSTTHQGVSSADL